MIRNGDISMTSSNKHKWFNDIKSKSEHLNFVIQSLKEERDTRDSMYNEFIEKYIVLRENCIDLDDVDYVMSMLYENECKDYEMVLMLTHCELIYQEVYLRHEREMENTKNDTDKPKKD